MSNTIFAATHLNSTPTLPPVADRRGQSPVPVILPRHDQAIGSAAAESVVLTILYEVTCIEWVVGRVPASELDETIEGLLNEGAEAEDIEIVVGQ